MMEQINSNYFEIITALFAVFVISCVTLSFTITDAQVRDKKEDEPIKYNGFQSFVIYAGVSAFWGMVFVSILVLLYSILT